MQIDMNDLLVISIFIGFAGGVCNGLLYKTGFSNGGLPIISQIIYDKFKIPIGKTNFVINTIIVLIGGYYFGITMIMYAIIINYINIFKGKIYDTMNNGIRLAIFYRTLGRIATVLLGLIISFYLLKDKESISESFKKYCKRILPEKVYNFCAVNIEDMDNAFSGYIRGQFTDGIIMSVIISVVLGIMGIKFPLIIGIISGLSNIIPYFGALIGFLLSVFMALVNGDVSKAVIVGIVIIVLQQIDGYVISPKVLEHSVKLNPVVIIIALAVGGKLFGLIGMVLAIPFVRFLKIKIEKRYQIE